MTTPTCGMMKKVEQYLTHRRSLGYRINSDGYQLRSFARYAAAVGIFGPRSRV